MCKATPTCTELRGDPEAWSKASPLPPPNWFADDLVKFAVAVRAAAEGHVERSRSLLRDVRGEEMRRWYLDHGQNSGGFRNRHYRVPRPPLLCIHSGKPPPSMIEAVFKRDHYRCRYCGLRLVPVDVLKAYEAAIGSASFRAANKNDSHGAALVFRATYDHVEPLNCGGLHDLSNLVAACYSCNFGKYIYTIQQLGLDDPRTRALPETNGWNGLVPLIPQLKQASFAAVSGGLVAT